MIDSIDLIIKSIKYLDLKNLEKLGIKIKKYRTSQSSDYDFGYKDIEVLEYNQKVNTKGYYDFGYVFEYKNISFKYSIRFKYLLLITKVSEIIQKDVVTLSDKLPYKQIVLGIAKEVLPLTKIGMELHRIDFMVDLIFPTDEMVQEYIKLLNKHDSRYLYTKKMKNKHTGKDYNTSIYLTNKTGQLTFNFYNKYQERLAKNDTNSENFKGVLRLEIQNRPAKLKAQLKKENGRDKTLDAYYNKESMIDNYFKLLKPYLYLGDYYKMKQAKKLINQSNLSKDKKEKLKKFLSAVEKYRGVKNVYKHKWCCEETGKKYIQWLNNLGINPITIDNNSKYDTLPNLYKLALATAEKNYFI